MTKNDDKFFNEKKLSFYVLFVKFDNATKLLKIKKNVEL